jgi:histidine triad (HIT) family protein
MQNYSPSELNKMINKSIFSKIIDREIPAQIVYETDQIIVIKDIKPIAPIHYLIIPKVEVLDMKDIRFDGALSAHMTAAVQYLAAQLAGEQSFNIIVNNGQSAGQVVMHLHWHFISGKNLYQNGFGL